MFVVLDWERLEAALIKVAGADGVVMRVPAHGVRVREPTKEVGHLAVVARPEHEVPVVRHDAIRQDARRMAGEGFIDDFEKRDVIAIFFEQRQPGHGSIESVVDVATRGMTCGSWHEEMMAELIKQVKAKLAASRFPVQKPQSFRAQTDLGTRTRVLVGFCLGREDIGVDRGPIEDGQATNAPADTPSIEIVVFQLPDHFADQFPRRSAGERTASGHELSRCK
jgi:hypothetical protein